MKSTVTTVVAAATGLLVSRAGSRFNPLLIGTDLSVLHRLNIWSGGLKMLYLAPISGLGPHEAGPFYSQWFQPTDTAYLYRTTYNDVLQIGIEHGVPFLVTIIAGAAGALVTPWLYFGLMRIQRDRIRHLLAAAYWSFCAISICSISYSVTTNALCSYILLLDLAALLVSLYSCRARWQLNVSCLVRTAMGATAFVVILMGSSLALSASSTLQIRLDKGTVRVSNAIGKRRQKRFRILVLLDRSSMGPVYGRYVRSALRGQANQFELIVPDPRKPLPASVDEMLETVDGLLCYGRSSELLCHLKSAFKGYTILVDPTEGSPQKICSNPRVICVISENMVNLEDWMGMCAAGGCVGANNEAEALHKFFVAADGWRSR